MDRARFGDKHLEFKAQFSRYYFNESVNEGGMGILDKDQTDVLHGIVMKNKSKNSKGILICGSGIGMSIAANRDKNIRAGLAFEPEIAKLMREHNDANVLVLPGRFMNLQDILKCIENFLTTNFEGGRHKNRINKLS